MREHSKVIGQIHMKSNKIIIFNISVGNPSRSTTVWSLCRHQHMRCIFPGDTFTVASFSSGSLWGLLNWDQSHSYVWQMRWCLWIMSRFFFLYNFLSRFHFLWSCGGGTEHLRRRVFEWFLLLEHKNMHVFSVVYVSHHNNLIMEASEMIRTKIPIHFQTIKGKLLVN